MRNIIGYTIKLGILYLGINWVADHPGAVKVIRNKMNLYVSQGVQAIDKLLTT
tara:strand:+ start:856 stop:1014 length:159 start_codon:yes stop_codon:yes gene_type:complete